MRLQPEIRSDLAAKLTRHAETRTGDVKRMSGRKAWRLRSGEYPVIFSVEGGLIRGDVIGHRLEISR